MGQWFRKWHVLLAVVIGVYLAIPKPSEPIVSFGDSREFPLGTELTTKDGYVISTTQRVKIDETKPVVEIPRNSARIKEETKDKNKDEIDRDKRNNTPFVVELNDVTKGRVQTITGGGFGFGWPLSAYKINLGQDLAGGTSLRLLVRSEALSEAEAELQAHHARIRGLGQAEVPARIWAVVTAQPQPGRDPLMLEDDMLEELERTNKLPTTEIGSIRASLARYNDARVQEGAQDLVLPTIEKLNRRLNSSGMTELNIVAAGKREIEVKLPSLSSAEAERLKDLLRSTGRLEFLLLPSEKLLEGNDIKKMYPGLPDENPSWYRWYEVLPSQTASELHARDELDYDSAQKLWIESKQDRSEAVFSSKFSVVTDRLTPPTKFVDKNGKEQTARVKVEVVLVQVRIPDRQGDIGALLEGYPITGDYLADATPSADRTGSPAVSFNLKGRGVSVMAEITEQHNVNGSAKDPRLLAVAIDRKLYSAATINDELSDQIQVSGRFTRSEVQRYVDTLRSGSLPVSLTLIGEETVGPAEGADNVARGWRSLMVGGLLVVALALLIYRRVGLLVIFSLALTITLILAVMAVFLSTLTLPGIAGLVLTVGMAIDANILINERIKEERAAGASGRMAIEAGFKHAFSAIVDGNLTTLITAIILVKIGTGPIAGFALTLSIGILSTLFTALVIYKTCMFWAYDRGLFKEITGIKIFPDREFNILGVGVKIAIINFILMLAAFGFFVKQAFNDEVFGIDFRGGTQVVMQLEEPITREALTEKLSDVPGLQVQARTFLGETREDPNLHARWEIRFPSASGETPESEDVGSQEDAALSKLRAAFGSTLAPSGFDPHLTGIEKADLTATIKVRRPTPTAPDTSFWLAHHADVPYADDPASGNWFADVGGTTLKPTFEMDGAFQRVTYKIDGISVSSDADLASKETAFHGALKRRLNDDLPESGRFVGEVAGTFPGTEVISRRETRAAVEIRLILLAMMDAKKLEDTVRDFLLDINDPLFNPALTVTPVGLTGDGKAREYLIRSTVGDIVWDTDGSNRSLGAAATLQTDLERWFDDNEPGNHVSNPFPKAAAIGGRVAGETKTRAIIALVIALLAIVLYIGIRFKSAAWGWAAVAALVHDTLLTLGAIALADAFLGDIIGGDLKLDLNAIAALLAVIGYSLNDTIIIFDRIREELVNDIRGKKQRPLSEVINKAVNLTLARTVLTSGTTLVVVLAMVILGGPAIRTFAWTLFFGLLFGTYSSIFRAGPFLMFFTGTKRDIRAEVAREEEARREAERAEAEALAAISTDRDTDGDEDGDQAESKK